jgi:hypothetical protein
MALLTPAEIDQHQEWCKGGNRYEEHTILALIAHIRTLDHEMNERGIRTGMIHDALESAKAHISEQDKALTEARERIAAIHRNELLSGVVYCQGCEADHAWLREHPAPNPDSRLAEARELLADLHRYHAVECSCGIWERTAAWLKEE